MNSFNYSALTTALKCNHLYKTLYVDKITPPGPESADMKFGTGIHLGVEEILLGNDGIEVFDLFWNIEREKPNRYGRYDWGALKAQAHVFLSRFGRLHAKKFNVYQMEQRLYGTIGTVRVEGTPDFIGDFEGKPSVVDFKTSGSRYNKDKIKIAEQLLLYAHLAQQQLDYEAEQVVYIVFIKGQTPSIQCLSAPIVRSVQSDILQNVQRIAEELMRKEQLDIFTKNRSSCIIGEFTCSNYKSCYPINGEDVVND